MLRRLASSAALVATTALLLVGCTPPEPTETTAVPSPSQSASPSPSPSPDAEQQLLDRSLEVSSDLLALVDQGFREGALPEEELRRIATEGLIAMLEADLTEFRNQGLQVAGSSELDSPMLVSNEPTSASDGSLVLATCWDTSGTTTTASDGEVVSGGVTRQPRLFEIQYTAREMLVTRTGPPSDPIEVPGCG